MHYENCTLCPRMCGADRTKGETGFCGAGDKARIAGAAPHYWEEPVICGEHGAGAVFFSACTMGCVYCQNSAISRKPVGQEVDSKQLRQILEELVQRGCSCVDLVTPTQFLPTILPALEPKLPVPVVYNCGGWEREETIRALAGKVDIYLPDLKYAHDELAQRLSAAGDYFATATAAIEEMFRQVGPVVIEGGRMKKGVIIRHLVLPGQVGNSLDVLEWVAKTFRKGEILLSVMSQYTPVGNQKGDMARPITEEEYDGVLSYMELLGLDEGFIQEFSSADAAYIPQWNI